ncbi:TetR/AcrR family transcriptional regulator [Phytohabitans kaempferiae]|uniref:TetR/AcrR family transcriptional regulator n=1 Tax=Phytohabitans kaempferiae TaxID=1620943 RepID=A0ABV6M7L5_9ACTN
MAHSTARVRRVRSASTRRAEIVRLAAELFDQEGYHQTSMETLAARAGVAKPTLYHYFSGKEAILREIHRDFIEPLIARHEMRLTTSMRPRQLLLEAMGDVLELMDTHRGHVRVFFEHHRELPPAAHAEVQARRDAYETHIEAVIERGVREGEFRAIDVRLTTLSIFGMCNWAYQWFQSEGSMRPREIAYLMWDIVERGIGAPGTV